MRWEVLEHPDFSKERAALPDEVKDKLAEVIKAMEQLGPRLKRPLVDTLNGSKHANMKEIRFKAGDGVWRFAFAFDPDQAGIILCGGDKQGENEKRFYKALIRRADARFDEWLESEE
jgi:hypothetical protein